MLTNGITIGPVDGIDGAVEQIMRAHKQAPLANYWGTVTLQVHYQHGKIVSLEVSTACRSKVSGQP